MYVSKSGDGTQFGYWREASGGGPERQVVATSVKPDTPVDICRGFDFQYDLRTMFQIAYSI
jgi:hypothetical protein